MNRRALLRIVVALLVVASLAFFAVALVRAWDEVDRWPSWPVLVGVAILWAGGLSVAATGWARLLGSGDVLRHSCAFLVAQIGKHLPGGIGQFAGQVGLARSAGVATRRSVVALTAFSITMGGSGAISLIILGVVWSEGQGWIRACLGVAGVIGVALTLDRRWVVWLLSRFERTRSAVDDMPAPRAMGAAMTRNVVSLAATSVAYSLVLAGLVDVDDPVVVAAAFAAAWTAGFLVLPAPSGLGVRELVLFGILGTLGFSGAVVVAASAIHRLVTIVTEGIVAGGAALVLRRLHVPTPFAEPPDPEILDS